MFNNSTGQQITSADHDSSHRSSRTSNNTPSSRSVLELETTLHESPITDGGNQGRGQSLIRDTNGHPIPLLPMYYANIWNGASFFPGHGTGNAAGSNSLGSDGYPSASAYGQPMPPNFQSGQTGEHRGTFYSGYPPAATTNPLPGGYTTYPPRPTQSTTNAQGESAAIWQSFCWINRAERDERCESGAIGSQERWTFTRAQTDAGLRGTRAESLDSKRKCNRLGQTTLLQMWVLAQGRPGQLIIPKKRRQKNQILLNNAPPESEQVK
ncbi:hypothetical protein BJY52DRAFT_1230907 [Lactarius psammicola]|nr:hypothetical protein BJY52DRAFT_1230907 [Lactarius psammicola]